MFVAAGIFTFVFLLHYSIGQDRNCDFSTRVFPDNTYFFNSPDYPNNYKPNKVCRWIATCPTGYNCRLICPEVILPDTASCMLDKLLVSKSGDSSLNTAETYCGIGSINAVSTGPKISIGFKSSSNSPGGKFRCQITAEAIAPTCTCGLKRKKNRIVGGQEATPHEYPMMAAIVRIDNTQIICGGTIIDPRHILTAAHCLDNRNPSSLVVVVGLHDVNSAGSKTKAYRISQFQIHPQYDKERRDFDIALLSLQRNIEFNMEVGPACLPFKFVNQDFSGSRVTVLGWGTLSPGGPLSETLQEVDLNVISDSSCKEAVPMATSRQICTFARGKDACQSDSGGPLLFTDASNGLLYHVGIVSYGISCANPSSPGVNTRVTNLLSWIQRTTRVKYCIR